MKPKTVQEIHEECIAGLNDLEEEEWDDESNNYENTNLVWWG